MAKNLCGFEMTAVALGLGSNKKFSCLRSEEILGGAVSELSKILCGVRFSSVYRTKAMYVSDQDDFFNMALVGFLDDDVGARALLEKIHEIEAAFGRDREKEIRFGPRSLDIDIEFFGRQKILENDLQIPHPRLKERAFVLVPLLEILDGIENEEAAIRENSVQSAAQSASHGDDLSCEKNPAKTTSPVAGPQAAQPAKEAAQPVNQDASPSIISRKIISANATTGTVDAQTARAACQIISSNATARRADNINGEIFCFCRDEIAAALSALGETDVEKVIRAQDFLPFIKSRLQNGTSSR